MMMHQCNYCSESFFSGYSLMSHMRIHNKEHGKGTPGNGTAFPGFVPPSTIVPGQPQIMDYSWHQNSWQWSNSSGTHSTGPTVTSSGSSTTSKGNHLPSQSSDRSNEDSNDSSGDESSSNIGGSIGIGNKKGKIYECPSCKKVFRSYPGLRYHRNSKHDQNGPYKCNFCEKRFCQKSHLSRHETLHTGEKNYSCTYCDKTFRIKGNLQIHIRIHTGEKPYSCSSCGKKFTQQQSAKSHEKLHLKYK